MSVRIKTMPKGSQLKGGPEELSTRLTTVGGGNSTPAPVLEAAIRKIDEQERLELLDALKRERDPMYYDVNVWFRYPKR